MFTVLNHKIPKLEIAKISQSGMDESMAILSSMNLIDHIKPKKLDTSRFI